MSAYLKFFELAQSPFEGEGQTQVVLGTRALRDAFASIETGLAEDASRICVNGKRGLGKTSLARALPKLLGETARVALIPDPTLSWEKARGTIARQWGLAQGGMARTRLLEAAREKRLVLVIDQAENASEEFLDHLDVMLSYRSEEDRPVVQSVLLARLGAEKGEDPAPLVWWLDRIQTLQLEFAPLPREGIESYITRHLKRAGWRGDRLFTQDAAHAIHGYTGGVPLEVSTLCERLLDEAASRGVSLIDASLVHAVCDVDPDAPEEELWDLADQFEDLALEDEFADADRVPESLADVTERMDPPCEETPEDGESTLSSVSEISLEEPVSGPLAPHEEPLEDTTDPDLDAAIKAAWPADTRLETEPPVEARPVEAPSSERPERPGPLADGFATDPDAARAPLDALELERAAGDPLDAPPSPEELRAIRGSGLARIGRQFAIGAAAAVVGGVLIALLMGDSDPEVADLSDSLSRTTQQLDLAPSAESGPSRETRPARTADDAAPPIRLDGGFVPIEALEELGQRRPNRAAD